MTSIRGFLIRLICILWWTGLAAPSMAAEPVKFIIDGIEGDVLANVQEALSLPPGLVRDGKVDRLWLERFAQQAEGKVRAAVEPFGYYSSRVEAKLETVREGEYILRVRVEPGEPVRVTDIEVAVRGPGAQEESLAHLAAAFPLQKGSVLLQPRYEKAKGTLKSRAEELGYLDADFPVHEIRIARPPLTARIKLVLETGGRYYFDDTRIEGGTDYPEEFLRRYLAFKPGEVFSFAKLGETQLNFTNSERFKEVIVTPEKQQARESKVPVLVQLKPSPRRHLRPGLGYGTDTGARFSIRFQDLNVFHRGHEFNSTLYLSERLQGLVMRYTLPSARDIKSSTGVQLNLQKEDIPAYVSELAAVELDRNHSFGKGKLGTAYVKLQQEKFTIGSQSSDTRLVLPGIRYSDDHYGNIIRPTRGFRYALDLRGTHRILGSDTSLLQLIADGSYLQPLPWRLSLHTRAKVGITMISDPITDLPPSLRFFAGGDTSVRGYSYQSLGPLDATGQVKGGKHLLVGSAELERAIFKNWGVSVFYDAGNAFDSFTDFKLFQGAGVGVHYYTPVGALNLSLARQIGVDSPAFRVHFTVGFEL